MRWIRSPMWDSVWLLSGLPIGLMLMAFPLSAVLTLFFVLNTAHVISPMAVAWGHGEFRRLAMKRAVRFILIPVSILLAATALGVTVGKEFHVNLATLTVLVDDPADYMRPFVWLLPVYFVWNLYHFGAQNFGLVSLYRRGWRSSRRRAIWKWSIVAVTVIGMEVTKLILWGFEATGHVYHGTIGVPKYWHLPAVSMFIFGFFAVNHSLVAIGLSSHVLARHYARPPLLCAAALIIAGAFGFWLLFCAPGLAVRMSMTAVGFRIGLGFVHFIYDRWIWKLSDPQVRAAIGRDLFPGSAV